MVDALCSCAVQQALDHVGALALADHAQPACLALERPRVAQRLHPLLEPRVLVRQRSQLGCVLLAGRARLLAASARPGET